ncbi:MAG: tetratricopeptide repeat protein, partial [Candidatus Omnitrophota bacterium]
MANRNRTSKIFLILLFFFFITNYQLPITNYCLFAQSDKEDEALFVAKKAFEDGFYEVSIGLLERFLKTYPEAPKAAEAELLIGQCYFHQNKFIDALAKFEQLLSSAKAREIKDAVLYWIAEVHFRGNAFTKAAQYYKMVTEEFPKSSYIPASVYSLGWCLFQESKFQEAKGYFQTVEEKFPKEPQAQDSSFKIIECLYSLKGYPAILEKIKQYQKNYPKDTAKLPYLYFYQAEADYYLNNFSDALSAYAKVISNTSDDKVEALSTLGMAWGNLKLKKYKEAEALFQQVNSAALERKSADALLLGKAILYFENSRFAESLSIYDELINKSQDPLTIIQASLGKADALYNLSDYPQAAQAYKEGLGNAQEDKSLPQEIVDKLRYGLSWSYLKEGKFKEAIGEFQKLVQHTEDKIFKISALCQIGDTYQDSGNYEKAASAYDQILKDNPDSFYGDYVQYQLGLALTKMRNFDAGMLAFQTLLKNYPDSKLLDDTNYALGLAYFQKEDYAASREVFAKFRSDFKESPIKMQAMYLEASSLYNLAKYQEAQEVFKDIIRASPGDQELAQKAEYEIADCFYQLGNEKEALDRFKALRSKYPDSKLTPEVVWWMGEYYYRHNDLGLARRYFSSLIQDFPKSNLLVSAYYALGSTYQDEAKYEEALDSFKKVVELDSSDLAGAAAVAMADIYVKKDSVSLALSTYRQVLEKHPNLEHLINPKMADIYVKIKEYGQALDLYKKSLDIVPVT